MKFLLFLVIVVSVNAKIVKMDDGSCYEREGKMNYIVPCPTKKKPEVRQEDSGAAGIAGSGDCRFRIGTYEMRYIPPKKGEGVSCIDAQEYIDRVNLNYDKTLKKRKKNIGTLIAKRALSKCRIDLYYGDFLTIGLMSGDRLMCDDLMADFPLLKRRRRH
jgi:hypothetical protein